MQTFKCSCFGQPPTKSNRSLLQSSTVHLQTQTPKGTGGMGAMSEGQLQQLGLWACSHSARCLLQTRREKDCKAWFWNLCFINVMFHSSTRFLSTRALSCQPWSGGLGAQSEQKLQLCMRNILRIKNNCEEMQIQTGSLQGKLKNIDF